MEASIVINSSHQGLVSEKGFDSGTHACEGCLASVWGGNIDAGARSLQPEAAPMFPSPKGGTRNVGADPEFIFAWSKGHALEKSPESAPLRKTIIQVSLDGGKTWKHPATPDSFSAKEHKYTYELMGDGNALQVRINDKPVSDNLGRLQIFLLPGA